MSLETSEALRQQFQLIQEQQQKKLLARKQRKAKNAEKTAPEDEGTNTANYWGHNGDTDDLDLKLDTTVSTGEDAFREKEVEELKDAVRVLKDENGRLNKLLGERDEEMRILCKARDGEKRALAGTGVAADTAAGRIMELSKRNRELTSDLESERNKVRLLSKKMQEMERELVSSEPASSEQKQRSDSEKDTSEVTAFQDKLNQANNKVAEFRNQCDKLKKDLKVAYKVLAKEIGEGFNISSLLNDSSGWRGRQQQITSLQNKVSELKGQLAQVARSGSAVSNNILLRSAVMSSPSSAPSQYDENHRSVLKKMEKDRKDAQEKTQADLEILEQEHKKLQQKHDASKARNKVLASELKGLKAQIQTLLEKGAHDDELIAALMREQQQLKSAPRKKEPTPPPKVVTTPLDYSLMEDLKKGCEERDKRIQQLEQDLGKANLELKSTTEKFKVLTERERKSVACSTEDLPTTEERVEGFTPGYGFGDGGGQGRTAASERGFVNGLMEPFQRGPLPLSAENFVPQNNGSGMHRKHINLEGLSKTQTSSVTGSITRRNVTSNASLQGLSGRGSSQGYQLPPTPPSGGRGSRGRRNSAGGSEEVRLLRSQVQESKSLCQASEVERDRLLELVSVLQRRLDEAKSSELEATNKWQQERRQLAHLEKQLNRVQSGQGVAKGKGKGYSSAGGAHDRQAKIDDLEELSTRLAIQTDENDALKEALNSTLKAKEEDLKYYQEMIDQTKKIFLQGLRQFRQNSAPS
ncbi:coiled-coil domain-containing protein 13-like [Montipora capricornis]|uniref:coiled-coil domain-containing protein 13-like n=1 Tax=Montipora capricornis TaxID=246305 RepID=UPI0035F13D16